jgi:hypothetical protein
MCSKLMAHVSRRVHLAATSSKMFHMFHISRPVQRGYLVLKCLEQTWKTVPHVSRKKQTANFASKHFGILAKGEGSFLEMAYCILYVFLGLLVWCVFYPSKNRQNVLACPYQSTPDTLEPLRQKGTSIRHAHDLPIQTNPPVRENVYRKTPSLHLFTQIEWKVQSIHLLRPHGYRKMKIPIEIHPNALWRSLQLVIDSANFATHTSETLVHPRTAKNTSLEFLVWNP